MPLDWMDKVAAAAGQLKAELDEAEGEAMYAGMLLPALVLTLVQSGLIDRARFQAALDHILLRFEEQQGAKPTRRAAFEHARSRLEHLLGLLDRGLPGSR